MAREHFDDYLLQVMIISFAFILFAFFCGSLPFSVWLGKALLGKDVRQYGDGNPGATNVFRAGNKIVGLLALMLDVSKAAIPVGLAYNNFHLPELPLFCVSIAPVLGHIVSPFLSFRGGKAVAPSLGVWIGLTMWKASLAGVLFVVIGILLFRVPGWAVMTGLSGIFFSLVIWMPDPLLFSVLAVQVVLLVWTHRHDLQMPPRLRMRPGLSLPRMRR
jgi:glycerol-3-phosphate acyltransferase PlsY